MAKPTYAVRITRPRAVDAGEARAAAERTFVKLVRASNRREAVMLVRAQHPDHEVLDDARRVDDGRRTPAARR